MCKRAVTDESDGIPPGVDRATAPALDGVIDIDHLAGVTLGDTALAHEILDIFDTQAGALLAQIVGKPDARTAAPTVAAIAHTLTGSARAVGAFKLQMAAEELERAAGTGDPAELATAIRVLAATISETRGAIAKLGKAG